MSYLVNALQLPNPKNPADATLFRQLDIWAGPITSALNALSASSNSAPSGNAGSLFSTVAFAGTNATIKISGALAQFVTGGTSIQNIVPPATFGGLFLLVPTTPFSLITGGNIKIPAGGINCIPNQMVIMAFDGSNWYAGRVS